MELTKYSRNRFLDSMVHWNIPKDYVDPLYNYLVYGLNPGGFFTSVLANDFMMAMSRSHPANTVEALKTVSGWIRSACPEEAWGNYDRVRDWQKMDAKQRRACLVDCDLVYTEQQEIMLALKNERTVEPMFF
jgi:hypothetical protein